MRIDLEKVSKRYTDKWIIRNCTFSFDSDKIHGIVGPNGSGKSTLIKLVSGHLSPSLGKIEYKIGDKKVPRGDVYKHLSLAAPYASFQKQLSLIEALTFVKKFKGFKGGMSVEEVIDRLDFQAMKTDLLSSLSSGQYQRVCLCCAIYADTEILLLDEPGSYLDARSKIWIYENLAEFIKERLVIIASNDPEDLNLCNDIIDVSNFH